MKTVVLDTNELTKDLMLTGLKYQLFQHMHHAGWLSVYVPAVVFEELVANHGRGVAKAEETLRRLKRERSIVGMSALKSAEAVMDYRTYVEDLFDEKLAFNVLPWPTTSHAVLVERAVTRTPPFDHNGGGYRDALVWADVVELARAGHHVALVSMDKAFVGEDGALAKPLEAEVDALNGSVELVRDFNSWLIAELPWKSIADLEAAVSLSRTSEFYDWYLQSDFQDNLAPSVEELGFTWAPYEFEIVDVVWDGDFTPVAGGGTAEEGLTLAEYELGQTVEFRARFPEGIEPDPEWRVAGPDAFRRVEVEGAIAMSLRVAVLFGGDVGFSIEELSWRRPDGVGPGAAVYRPELDPSQPALFGEQPRPPD